MKSKARQQSEKGQYECFTVEDEAVNEIRSLKSSGANIDDLAAQIQKTARIGPELIKYIAKSKTTA